MQHQSTLVLSLALLRVTATAATLYWGGGTVDIPDGTALTNTLAGLTGTWNLTTRNWATSTNGATYTSWSDGIGTNEVHFGYGVTNPVTDATCTITLATDVSLNRLTGNFVAKTGRDSVLLAAATPVTLTLTGSEPTASYTDNDGRYEILSCQANVRLAGSSGFSKIGNARFRVQSDSAGLTGNVTVKDGTVELSGSGNLKGITTFEATAGTTGESEGLYVAPGTAGAQDAMADACRVRLTGGAFIYSGYKDNATPSTETIGKIVVESSGHLDPSGSFGTGTQMGRLILADAVAGIDRGLNGKGVLAVGAYRAYSLGLNTDVVVQNGYPTETILPWMAHRRGYAMQLTAAGVITNWPMADAPLDLATWVPNSDYRVMGEAGAPFGAITNLTLRSLGALLGTSRTITIGGTNTLTISSGHINVGRETGLGGHGDKYLTIAGGNLTSGTSELYLLPAVPSGYLTVSSAIIGALDLVAGGMSTVTLSGSTPNTHTGTTYVQGYVNASKTDNVIAVPGNLEIGGSGTLTCHSDNQITNAAAVTVRGTLQTYDNDDQAFHNTVTIAGGTLSARSGNVVLDGPGTGLVFNGGLFTDSSSFGDTRLLTDVSYAASSEKQARFSDTVGEVIQLARTTSATRTFDVADSGTLPEGTPEMVAAMPFTESSAVASVRKTGDGALEMATNHTYSGATTIEDGTLLANGPASSTGSGPVNVTNGGTLGGRGVVRGVVSVGSGASLAPGDLLSVGTLTVSNDVTLATGAMLKVDLASGGNDLLAVDGDLAIAGEVTPSLLGGYAPPANGEWTIATVTGGGTIDTAGATAASGYSLRVSGPNVVLLKTAGGTTVIVR